MTRTCAVRNLQRRRSATQPERLQAICESFGPEQLQGFFDRWIALAERYRTRMIATLDRRHFNLVRSLDGSYFEVLPRLG